MFFKSVWLNVWYEGGDDLFLLFDLQPVFSSKMDRVENKASLTASDIVIASFSEFFLFCL